MVMASVISMDQRSLSLKEGLVDDQSGVYVECKYKFFILCIVLTIAAMEDAKTLMASRIVLETRMF